MGECWTADFKRLGDNNDFISHEVESTHNSKDGVEAVVTRCPAWEDK